MERRTTQPLVDLRIGGWSVAAVYLVAFVIGYATIAAYISIPAIVSAPPTTGYGLGSTTITAGLILLPLGIAGTRVAPLTGRLERRVGSRTVMAMSCVALAGSCALLLLARQQPVTLVFAAALMGLGLGCGLTQAMNSIATIVPAARVASVAGLVFVVKSVGGTLGGQVSGSVLASDFLPATPLPTWSAYMTVFAIAAALTALAIPLSLALPSRRRAVAHAAPGKA